MTPTPPYAARDLEPTYQLRYTWTGWPSECTFPDRPDDDFFDALADHWERDGIRPLEWSWSDSQIQLCASTKPSVAPTHLAARLKGRLQHALRKADTPVKFSRKLSICTVGDANRETLESYVEAQTDHEPLADPTFAEFLEQFTVVEDAVNLAEPTASNSGRYWYNLHLVLVTHHRHRVTDAESLTILRDGSLAVAERKEHEISRLAVMPDHLHITLRGDIERSPEEIALDFLNNLAHLIGQDRFWQPSYFAGTFGEYDMWAIRNAAG